MEEVIATKGKIEKQTMLDAFRLMSKAKALTELYEDNKSVCSKYVHATSRGHEAIQLACGQGSRTFYVYLYQFIRAS